MKKNWTDLQHLLCFIAARFGQDRCAQMAASLTYTTLLSLVPLITIALTLFSAFPVFADFSGHIKSFLLGNMMPETGKMVLRYVEQFAESAARLTAVGIVFLALTAMLMMHTIDDAFNTIWRVSRPRPLVQRVLVYWAVLTLAPLLIGGSLSLTSWLVGMSVGYARQIPELGVAMLKVVPVLLTTLAFSLLFRVVPNRYVPMRHATTGGVVAALAFESMNRAFAFYIAHFPTYKLVYGAFASIPIFLLWIYLSWLTILMGALIAASLSHWRGDFAQNISPVEQLYYALHILRTMSESMRSGAVQTLPALSRQLHIGFDSLEQIMEKLAQARVVRKLAGSGWAMIRDAQHVQLAELYRLFVFDPSVLVAQGDDAEIHAWLGQIERHVADATAATLHDLFTGAGSHGSRSA
ncbi:MAG: YihY family inner membrane protein [Betaproteobacteria bacterium]|nr:YihY family inner membrane protein [Betaproteobacteria bacterium]